MPIINIITFAFLKVLIQKMIFESVCLYGGETEQAPRCIGGEKWISGDGCGVRITYVWKCN